MAGHKTSFDVFFAVAQAALRRCRPAAFSALFLLAACAQTASIQGAAPKGNAGGAGAANASAQATFPDIPIPDGAKMVVDKTLVVGSTNWFGQLTLESGYAPNDMFDFYRNRLPQFQWREITSVRAPVSVLTYDREDRILQMQIRASTLRGSEITITVSPRGSQQGGGAGGGIGGGAMPAPVTRIN